MYTIMMWSFASMSTTMTTITPRWRGWMLIPANTRTPHEKAHANDIKKRFANRSVTTGQIILFGLTGGLIPCPAAITVLLLCIQVKEFTLGAALVLCFSIGLAITLVSVGAAAAFSVRQATKRWSGLDTLARVGHRTSQAY
jgi:ABC-type nickel/cobalt efflux system permease component RcnA